MFNLIRKFVEGQTKAAECHRKLIEGQGLPSESKNLNVPDAFTSQEEACDNTVQTLLQISSSGPGGNISILVAMIVSPNDYFSCVLYSQLRLSRMAR